MAVTSADTGCAAVRPSTINCTSLSRVSSLDRTASAPAVRYSCVACTEMLAERMMIVLVEDHRARPRPRRQNVKVEGAHRLVRRRRVEPRGREDAAARVERRRLLRDPHLVDHPHRRRVVDEEDEQRLAHLHLHRPRRPHPEAEAGPRWLEVQRHAPTQQARHVAHRLPAEVGALRAAALDAPLQQLRRVGAILCDQLRLLCGVDRVCHLHQQHRLVVLQRKLDLRLPAGGGAVLARVGQRILQPIPDQRPVELNFRQLEGADARVGGAAELLAQPPRHVDPRARRHVVVGRQLIHHDAKVRVVLRLLRALVDAPHRRRRLRERLEGR
eukprot:7390589-Prymnesium_polylepis.1